MVMLHSHILGAWKCLTLWNSVPAIGRQLFKEMLFWQFSTHKIYATVRGKLSELHYNALLVSNRGEKVMKRRKTMGQICPIVFRAFQTFSPRLENNESSKCGSENFPRMVTYILCVENCQNNILTHSCLPIAGTLFYNVRHFHAPRIWECNI